MKFEEEIEKLQKLENSFFIRKYQLENGEQLIHYTSPHALKSILDNQELWLTRVDFFLDKSENKFAFSVLKDALQYVSINDEFRKFVHAFCMAFFYPENASDDIKSLIDLRQMYYVASFSTKCDDLFMWNSYTYTEDRSGYAILFENSFINDGYDAGSEFRLFGKVTYEKEKQVAIFIEMLNKFNDWHIENSKHEFDADWRLKSAFSNAFFYQSIFIKKYCFSAENEYRIVFVPSGLCNHSESPCTLSGNEENLYHTYPVKVKYREKSGIIIPYFPIKLNLEKIESIMPSPYMNYDIAEKGLKAMFSTKSLKTRVKKSEIPF